MQVQFLSWKDPLEKRMTIHSSILSLSSRALEMELPSPCATTTEAFMPWSQHSRTREAGTLQQETASIHHS